MTQGHLADATGLTPVHVNRSLKALTERGLITEHVNHIAVVDWCGLQAAGEFDDAYLHLPSEGARALKRLPSALSRH